MNPLLINEYLSLGSTVLTMMSQMQVTGSILQKMQAEGRSEPTAEEWAQAAAAKKAARDALNAHIDAMSA